MSRWLILTVTRTYRLAIFAKLRLMYTMWLVSGNDPNMYVPHTRFGQKRSICSNPSVFGRSEYGARTYLAHFRWQVTFYTKMAHFDVSIWSIFTSFPPMSHFLTHFDPSSPFVYSLLFRIQSTNLSYCRHTTTTVTLLPCLHNATTNTILYSFLVFIL